MRLAVATLLAVALLTGCRDHDETAALKTASGMPTCETIWVAGSVLPEDYEGCEKQGTQVALLIPCSNVQPRFAEFAAEPGAKEFMFALTGEAIQAVRPDDGSLVTRFTVLDSCRGS
jgi:hypothetical protein